MIASSLSIGAYVPSLENKMFVGSNLASKRKAEILDNNDGSLVYTSVSHPYKVRDESGQGFKTTSNAQDAFIGNDGDFMNQSIMRGNENEVKFPLI